MREGVNRSPLELYFDTVDFPLHPVHPFLHLLPAAESQRIEEAGRRFGWKERNSRKLKELPGIESKQEAANRPKSFESMLPLADFRHALRSCADQEEEPAAASCICPGT